MDKKSVSFREEIVIRKLVGNVIGHGNKRHAVFYACFLFLFTSWFPEGCKSLLIWMGLKLGLSLEDVSIKVGFIQLFVSLGILVVIYYLLGKLSLGKIKVVSSPANPRKVLIMFLSNLTPQPQGVEFLKSDEVVNMNSIEEFLAWLKGKRISWEMSFIAINHHNQKLERIYVFTSAKSREHQELFQKTVNRLFPKVIVDWEPVETYENAEIIYEKINILYENLAKDKYREKDVVVDVTGGQKINSISAAIATLVSGRQFQYISTEDTSKVISYDIEVAKDE